MKSEKPRNFEEFWQFYLNEHKSLKNRRLHFIGTSLALISLTIAAIANQPWFILVALVMGYGPAWIGHFFMEKNRPATFRYPFYSLLADFRMFYLTLNGKINSEVERLRKPGTR